MLTYSPNKTLDYYESHAEDFATQTVSVNMQDIYVLFTNQLPQNTSQYILDVGCGSGRDADYFASLGYQVTAVDGSINLIEWAKQYCISDRIDWYVLSFKDIKNQKWQGFFTGIWACASLLHVPFSELAAVIEPLIDTLTEDGVLYASFKYGEGERIESNRFFCNMNEQRWSIIVSEISHVIEYDMWLSVDKRPGHKGEWFNVVIKKGT